MARFATPANTITDINELRPGLQVWEANGMLTPYSSHEPHTVVTAPHPFRENKEYDPIHSSQGDEMVYDARHSWHEGEQTMLHFCGDRNFGKSHNDTYLFRTKEDADNAVAYFTEQWEANPAMKAEELERQAWADEMDRMMEYDYDYNE